jgi:hypothetical protein
MPRSDAPATGLSSPAGRRPVRRARAAGTAIVTVGGGSGCGPAAATDAAPTEVTAPPTVAAARRPAAVARGGIATGVTRGAAPGRAVGRRAGAAGSDAAGSDAAGAAAGAAGSAGARAGTAAGRRGAQARVGGDGEIGLGRHPDGERPALDRPPRHLGLEEGAVGQRQHERAAHLRPRGARRRQLLHEPDLARPHEQGDERPQVAALPRRAAGSGRSSTTRTASRRRPHGGGARRARARAWWGERTAGR